MSIISKVQNFIEVTKVFENWHIFLLDHFGLIRKKEVVYRTRSGLKFIARTNSLDRWVIKEMFGVNPYSKVEIKQGDVVVDVGAHIGCYTLLASLKLKGRGKVYAYEPDPGNYDLLERNISINHCSIAKAYNKGIFKERRRIKLYQYARGNKLLSGNSSFSSFQPKAVYDARIVKTIEVECITLEDVFNENSLERINVLKMDCEGAEYEILFSTSEEILRRIDRICLEYHDHLSQTYSHKDLIRFLSELGFKVEHHVLKTSVPHTGMIYAWNQHR